jgi:hypothetical protein
MVFNVYKVSIMEFTHNLNGRGDIFYINDTYKIMFSMHHRIRARHMSSKMLFYLTTKNLSSYNKSNLSLISTNFHNQKYSSWPNISCHILNAIIHNYFSKIPAVEVFVINKSSSYLSSQVI